MAWREQRNGGGSSVWHGGGISISGNMAWHGMKISASWRGMAAAAMARRMAARLARNGVALSGISESGSA
jgi:hypothetical protein